MSELTGLRLTRSERILVIALSYLFCAPLIYKNGKHLLIYIASLSAEARRQVRREDQERELDEQLQRIEQLRREVEAAAAATAQ